MWNQKPYVDSQIRNFDYIAAHLTPDAEAADSGKVLTVGSDGKPEWAEGGGGSSGGNVILINSVWSDDTATLDKTWTEISTIAANGNLPVIITASEGQYSYEIVQLITNNGSDEYVIITAGNNGSRIYTATTADGYPVYED